MNKKTGGTPTIVELEKQFLDEDKKTEYPQKEIKDEIKKEEIKNVEEKEEEEKNKTDENLKEKPVERPIWTMPVSKAKKEKEKAIAKAIAEKEVEFNAKLEAIRQEYEKKLSEGKPTNKVDDKLTKFAEENGIDVDAAKGLLNIFKEEINQTIQKPEFPEIAEVKSLLEKQKMEQIKQQASNEFDNQVLPLLKTDSNTINTEALSKIKDEILQFAFTPKYHTYSLADIYLLNKDKWATKNNHTAENSGGRTSDADNLKNLSEEEAMKLPAQQYVKWMDMQGTKSQYVDL